AAGKPRVMGESASAQAILFERRRSGDRDAAVSQVAGVAHPLDDVSQAEITQSLAKTEEFGALLESGLANLRTVQDEGQFSKRKGEVLGELEKLLKSHRHLTSHFDKMVNYLSSIQTDSERLSEELSRVTMLSLTDELTGLPNRRAFIQRLRDEVARVQRYGHTLSLAIIDLDDFKPINDTYGHPAGDAVLNTYAKDVLTTFRRHDMVARYGGEEFALIFPYTETQGALQALKKIQSLAVATACRLEKTAIPLPTFSAGLAVYHRGESVDSLIKRADSALYSAKDLGRNRIEIA
ncbi:MAG: GGDEF domain-containing protein, partial [Gammaproteobacteria bacterium]|nr:GGDEF domain-containing protein [Gammaproteobacteria bacterium]